jgi:hypothetical protein
MVPSLVCLENFSTVRNPDYKGPKPRLGDLTYTQAVICGYPRRRLSCPYVRRASQITGLAKVLLFSNRGGAENIAGRV